MQELQRGVIFSKAADRGFGFLLFDDQKAERRIFFHATGVVGTSFEEIKVGDKVDFLMTSTPKGAQAYAVRLVTEENDG